MISLAGLGDAIGVGEVAGVGESAGVGAVLGLATAADGLTSGEAVACWFVRVQALRIKTNPATTVAGTTPLIPIP